MSTSSEATRLRVLAALKDQPQPIDQYTVAALADLAPTYAWRVLTDLRAEEPRRLRIAAWRPVRGTGGRPAPLFDLQHQLPDAPKPAPAVASTAQAARYARMKQDEPARYELHLERQRGYDAGRRGKPAATPRGPIVLGWRAPDAQR